MKPWKRIEPTRIHKVGYRTIVTKLFKLPNGETKEFDTVNSENWGGAAIIALTSLNKVVVARQFRPGPELVMDELPGGVIDEGENPDQAVRRELLEETGYVAGHINYLGVAYYDAYTNGKRHCFLAKDCKPRGKGLVVEKSEHIELLEISLEDLLRNAKEGRLTDPGAVLLAYEELQKLIKKQSSV